MAFLHWVVKADNCAHFRDKMEFLLAVSHQYKIFHRNGGPLKAMTQIKQVYEFWRSEWNDSRTPKSSSWVYLFERCLGLKDAWSNLDDDNAKLSAEAIAALTASPTSRGFGESKANYFPHCKDWNVGRCSVPDDSCVKGKHFCSHCHGKHQAYVCFKLDVQSSLGIKRPRSRNTGMNAWIPPRSFASSRWDSSATPPPSLPSSRAVHAAPTGDSQPVQLVASPPDNANRPTPRYQESRSNWRRGGFGRGSAHRGRA